MNRRNELFFFIGTEAELIKIFPVIIECQKLGAICNIIASGQNNIIESRIIKSISLNGKIVALSDEKSIKKSAVGLFKWFFSTKKKAINIIKESFEINDFENRKIIVHGDTVSTYMGALIGKKMHMEVCHVEAGLRSHHLFNPFPEEIDRLLTSRIARVHFAPGNTAVENLKKAKGTVIDTKQNTLLDSLRFSKNMPVQSGEIDKIISSDTKYFVFVMHRQENLAKKDFVESVFSEVEKNADTKKCVLILHKITENTLQKFGILEKIKNNSNFILLHRVDYFDFMKLLRRADYVITDGGSNQEELFFMNIPTLILRKTTERFEGLQNNAELFAGNLEKISMYREKESDGTENTCFSNCYPSQVVANKLLGA